MMDHIRHIETKENTRTLPDLRRVVRRKKPHADASTIEAEAQNLADALGRPLDGEVIETWELHEYLVDNGRPDEPTTTKKWVQTGQRPA